ncbi:uncharacterized protein [Apostichopus japonicus]|uniref:uncharacterized protein n=1 Tax=Stichopus japonicus TaxID=307972 RepID=UPI003AB1CA94
METAFQNVANLQRMGSASQAGQLNALNNKNRYGRFRPSSDTKATNNTKPCYRCGRKNHTPNDCYFKEKVCNACNKTGHIAKICRSKNTEQHKCIQKSLQSENEMYSLFVNRAKEDVKEAIKENVTVNGHDVTFEIDTGASFTIISEKQYDSIGKIKLSQSYINLRTYTGETLNILGMFTADIDYMGRSSKLPLYVVVGEGLSLIGRNWLVELKLDWERIFNVNSFSGIPTSLTH